MSQLLEQKTNSHELQPEQTFNLNKLAIDQAVSPYPRFYYEEISEESKKEKGSRTFVATTESTLGSGDTKSVSSFVINDRGELQWTSGDEIELVMVRGEDGSTAELGAEGDSTGVIDDIAADDELYIISKEFATIMKSVSSFDKNGFATAIDSPEIKADVVRVRFNEAMESDSASNEMLASVNTNQANALRRRNKQRMQKIQADLDSPVDVMQAFADDEESQAQITAAKGYTVTDKRHRATTPGKELELYRGEAKDGDTNQIGISEAIEDELARLEKERLSERVEKYTEKVATYEEIAASALAKRMKGRLYNPLTRRNKEKAREDDLNMHLLEGFSRALDGALMKQWIAEGYSDEEAANKIFEHQQARQEARAARNHDELRKGKLGSFLDKYANMSKGKKIGIAIGAAATFGAIGLVAGGALGVAGGIGLAGAKVGKAYLQQRSKIYEKGTDKTMLPPDRPVSVSNGHATKRTAAEQVFAGMSHDEKKREMAIQKADRNKKIAVGIAAISAVAIGTGAIIEHSDEMQHLFSKQLPEMTPGNADGDWVSGDVPASVPEVDPAQVPVPVSEFSVDASTVTNGEGWYQTIQEVTNITDPAQQANILQKIGPVLQEKGWAYPMNDGTWGISRPGTLPKDVLELIKNSR